MEGVWERLYGALMRSEKINKRAVIGLDGFVDEIVRVVDVREDECRYTSMHTMTAYANRICRAAGLSTNIELARQGIKIGGNGPIMANALGALAVPTTAVGLFGIPVLPLFQTMEPRCELISVGEPGWTDAIEFSDGKIISSKLEPLLRLRWEDILHHVGLGRLIERLDNCGLFALQNWTMLPHMDEIYEGLLREVLPNLNPIPDERIAFFDIADPEKRSDQDIRTAVGQIKAYEGSCRVAFSMNYREAARLAGVLEVKTDNGLEELARGLREALGITWVLIHLVDQACMASAEGYVHVVGPYCPNPVLTTGAGDNFNAGVAWGLLAGLDRECILTAGTAVSGYYVRHGKSPSRAELAVFLKEWCGSGI